MRVKFNTSKTYPPVIERNQTKKGPYSKGHPGWGVCYQRSGAIEVDPRLRPLDYLDTLIHELMHREMPLLREEFVTEVATVIAKELWEKNFRRIQ
jgi:hypothetical protein